MAGIYIHIPFCKRRCIYCDFFSTTQSEKKSAYVRALCRELEMRRDYVEGEEIETIYLGGGTPSQLTEEELKAIFSSIYHIYKVKTNAEITLEANPDDLTPEYVAMLRQLPVNRISMGIQTFQEETLKLLHRRHTATQAIEAFRRCREAGFQNISIDLMYGLPGETWRLGKKICDKPSICVPNIFRPITLSTRKILLFGGFVNSIVWKKRMKN